MGQQQAKFQKIQAGGVQVTEAKKSRASEFVAYVQARCKADNGFAARLKRVDNPDMAHQSWELLVRFDIGLQSEYPRNAYQLIAAAVAKSKGVDGSKYVDGQMSLGKAIAIASLKEGASLKQGEMRLGRLLASDDVTDVCMHLRHVIQFIQSRLPGALNYAQLLQQLISFHYDSQKVKAQWAESFYRASHMQESNSSEGESEHA